MSRLALATLFAFSFLVSMDQGAAQSPQEPVTLGWLLARATTYVEMFVKTFSRAIAEEHYVQEYYEIRREGSRGSFLGTPQLRERRRLTSDFLLVQPAGARDWYVFRDVFEVDKRAVRDRAERLSVLFLEPNTAGALDRAAAIARESSRYHLRDTGTIDHPLLALGFLQRPYQGRFRYAFRGQDRSAGPDVWVVEFREQTRPTIIRGNGDTDVLAIGRLWIESRTGHIVRSELEASSTEFQSKVTTTFAFDEAFGVAVPSEMRYQHQRGVLSDQVRGTATYGRFRRFLVRTDERIDRP